MTTVTELFEGWTRGLENGAIVIPRCDACGSWNWYPRSICTKCGGESRSLQEVGPTGFVDSWTRVHQALPPVQQMAVPYLIAIIELTDAPGVRIPCKAIDAARDPIMREGVAVVISRGADSGPFTAFAYRDGN